MGKDCSAGLSFWSHCCALNPCFAWEANDLGAQLCFRSQATKMHFVAFSHVLRRLFGNQTEHVCGWADAALAGLGGHMAESMAQHPWALGWDQQCPLNGEWSSHLQLCFFPGRDTPGFTAAR